MLKRTLTQIGIAAATLALTAMPVLAAVGTQNPNLTVELTLNPTVVTAPGQVTVVGKVTNNSNKTNRVVAKVDVVSPSGVTSTLAPKGASSAYTEKYTIAAGGTVTETVVYNVPADAQKGVYTITLSATDKKGSSWATEYLTVQ